MLHLVGYLCDQIHLYLHDQQDGPPPAHCLYRLLSVACALFVPVTFCCLRTVCTGYFLLPVRLTAIGHQGSNKKCWVDLVLDDSSAWVQTWGTSR